jgi:hypothetical protein
MIFRNENKHKLQVQKERNKTKSIIRSKLEKPIQWKTSETDSIKLYFRFIRKLYHFKARTEDVKSKEINNLKKTTIIESERRFNRLKSFRLIRASR